ncbi:MAG: gliding motility lipoprotein GldH, partial [Bacteroidota bacterium]
MKKILFGLGLLLIFSACNTLDQFEQTVLFPEHEWKSENRPGFSFEITDTASLYNFYLILRHEDSYHFNNIWLKVGIKAPGDTVKTQLINVTLADNKKGWLGTGMDDIFDHRARITRTPVKLKKGMYTFTLQQHMREEPLRFVMNAGIRVEKA